MTQKVIVLENENLIYSNDEINPLIMNLIKGFEIIGKNLWNDDISYLSYESSIVSISRIENKTLVVIDREKIDFKEFLENNKNITSL